MSDRAHRRLDPSQRFPFREGSFSSPLHDERTAAIIGVALGVAVAVCFVTGIVSHVAQEDVTGLDWPARPAGLYRLNQGLHVTTGLASIPLVLAKLWVVYPDLFRWPVLTSTGHAVERLALLPLIGGLLVLVVTGLGNINLWRPWEFSFRTGHFAAAWLVAGGLVIHLAAKWATTRAALTRGAGSSRSATPTAAVAEPGGVTRRSFLTTVFGTSALITLFTVGQTAWPLRRLALLAPRRPDVGPQGFPVNRTAESVGLAEVDVAGWRLVVDGPGVTSPLELGYEELRALPQHEAVLPIACVEGWSASRRWRGVSVPHLLDLAGAGPDAEATVVAMHESSRQRTSDLNRSHAHDPDTLLALEVDGEVLHPDHGFPLRLIGPNRPGVDQTKWVERLEVR